MLDKITDSYTQHLDCNGHITSGRTELHRLDETVLVPEGQAGVCYSGENKIERVEKDEEHIQM